MTSPNEHLLAGLCCPECGSPEPLVIYVSCWATLRDTHVRRTEDMEWSEDSACYCDICGWQGRVSDFTEEEDRDVAEA